MPSCISRAAVAASVAVIACGVHAQETPASPPTPSPADATSKVVDLGPLFEAERNVRQIYAQFFKRSRSVISHERGWEELQRYANDDRIYRLLLELFERQPTAVRNQLSAFFAQHTGEHAQTMLAWVAIFEDRNEPHRMDAEARLAGLIGDGEPSYGAQRVMSIGLKSGKDSAVNAAANLVRQYNLLRAVPLLAQAQAQPRGGAPEVRTGALAQIVVGTQQAFIADLTPVVATAAVAFQPTVGVVSSGTVLRVIDAVVYEYRTDVHQVLVDMTTAASGEATGHLGYDAAAWHDWYARVLEPELDKQDAARAGG